MKNAWREPDDIVEDLASGDDERIRVGIAGLLEFAKGGDEFELPAIEPWLLQVFGEPPPEDIVIGFARLLARYRSFVPKPPRSHVVRQLIEIAVRYAVGQVAYETSLEIQIQENPAVAARDAVGYLQARGLETPREIAAAVQLIRYLLEAKAPVRRAATEALAAWWPTDTKDAIVAAVLPLADSDQRNLLTVSTGGRLPTMKFQDAAVNRQEQYTLGVEQNSGRYYLSIPASNGFIVISEYYEISEETFKRYRADLDSALPFVIRCRNRLEDPRLMYQPSIRRGTAC